MVEDSLKKFRHRPKLNSSHDTEAALTISLYIPGIRRCPQLVRADPVFQELPDLVAAVQERALGDLGF